MKPSASRAKRYVDLQALGEGGQGTLWKAFDRSRGEWVAIKVLKPRVGSHSRKASIRFEREIASLLCLEHPNIVRILDHWGREGSRLFAMEYVEGESLARFLERRRPLPCEAVAMVRQIAAALAAAHERGIVHRDVKPANVLVQGDGTVKLVDFGTMRYSQEEFITAVTEPDAIVGTLGYLPPEAFSAAGAVPASDVFQAGVLLYEMLAGRQPLKVASSRDLASGRAASALPRLVGRVQDVDEYLDEIVRAALSPRPADRPTARGLYEALSLWLALREPRHRQVPPCGDDDTAALPRPAPAPSPAGPGIPPTPARERSHSAAFACFAPCPDGGLDIAFSVPPMPLVVASFASSLAVLLWIVRHLCSAW